MPIKTVYSSPSKKSKKSNNFEKSQKKGLKNGSTRSTQLVMYLTDGITNSWCYVL